MEGSTEGATAPILQHSVPLFWPMAAVAAMGQAELELFRNITSCFQNTHPFFKERINQVPEYGEICRSMARTRLEWLDSELVVHPFIAGPHFTIADITALVAIDFGRISDIRIQPNQKNLQRWYDAVSSRPSAKA